MRVFPPTMLTSHPSPDGHNRERPSRYLGFVSYESLPDTPPYAGAERGWESEPEAILHESRGLGINGVGQ